MSQMYESTKEEREEGVMVIDAAIARVKQGWTQGHDARDKDDTPVNFYHDSACKWCMFGAIYRGEMDAFAPQPPAPYTYFAVNIAREAVLSVIKQPDIGPWNDAPGRTVEEVVAALEEAKKYLETED